MQFTSKDYPGIPHAKLKKESRLKNLNYENPKLDDVEQSFKNISRDCNYLAVKDNDLFKKQRYIGRNRGGSAAKTHFQGICRVRNGRNFVFSGGDLLDSSAQIFSSTVDHFKDNIQFPGEMSSVVKGNILRGPIGSNLFSKGNPPDSDKLSFITQINDRIVDGKGGKGYWHAGGISISGDILAVPLESNEDSKIRFFSIKNPNKPIHLENCDIPRNKNVGKAGTASLCRLKNGRFLCSVWQDGKNEGEQCIDFYISKDDTLEHGFNLRNFRWNYKKLIGLVESKTKYQMFEFVVQSDDQIYLIGTENTSPIAPKLDIPGENIAELLKFTFDLNLVDQPDQFEDSISLSLENRRAFAASDEYHNFSAGAGIYISAEKELLIYSVYHYRRNGEIRFVEFPPVLSSYQYETTSVSQAKIELYEKENFEGRVLKIYGKVNSTIENYTKCFVQGKKFGKGVASIKYILPANCTYAFYEDKKGVGAPLFDMKGSGFYKDAKKIGSAGKKVMSSKFVKIDGNDV